MTGQYHCIGRDQHHSNERERERERKRGNVRERESLRPTQYTGLKRGYTNKFPSLAFHMMHLTLHYTSLSAQTKMPSGQEE